MLIEKPVVLHRVFVIKKKKKVAVRPVSAVSLDSGRLKYHSIFCWN